MLYVLVPSYGWPETPELLRVSESLDTLRKSVELTCSKCTKLKDEEREGVYHQRFWLMEYRGPKNARFRSTIVAVSELMTRVDHL